MDVVKEQANDPALWEWALAPREQYLQQALRRLTEAVEGKTSDQCARDALKKITN